MSYLSNARQAPYEPSMPRRRMPGGDSSKAAHVSKHWRMVPEQSNSCSGHITGPARKSINSRASSTSRRRSSLFPAWHFKKAAHHHASSEGKKWVREKKPQVWSPAYRLPSEEMIGPSIMKRLDWKCEVCGKLGSLHHPDLPGPLLFQLLEEAHRIESPNCILWKFVVPGTWIDPLVLEHKQLIALCALFSGVLCATYAVTGIADCLRPWILRIRRGRILKARLKRLTIQKSIFCNSMWKTDLRRLNFVWITASLWD